jgi:hypothetical protein
MGLMLLVSTCLSPRDMLKWVFVGGEREAVASRWPVKAAAERAVNLSAISGNEGERK